MYLEPGKYKVEYIYVKDNSKSEGLDAGFVKNIRTSLNYTQTELNIFNLQKSTNQYVWVPISEYELEEIYGVDKNGKLWGKLYEKDYNPTTTHSTSGLNWTILDDGTMSITNPIGYREPDVTRAISSSTSSDYRYDFDSQLSNTLKGETRYELLSKELEQDFYETIESIKKYGGFYIGRYETGDSGVVQKMRKDSNTTWYNLYPKCKALKGENNNVETTMLSGNLWDATLRWYIASGEKASNGEKIDNNYITNYNYAKYLGNYFYSEFKYIEDGAPRGPLYDQEKKAYTNIQVATGSTEHTKINNIYDMGGNMREWTAEANDSLSRVARGGGYYNYVDNYYPSKRYSNYPSHGKDSLVRAVFYVK